MIKVSIIVPIYNTGSYLKKCIDSLVNQTEKEIEILLINDGSTDNSEKIVKDYKDDRIIYISKKNEGIGKTRNLGIKKARGKYLMFIDSDDYIKNTCVEIMYKNAIENNADIVISNFYKDYDGNILKIEYPYFEPSSLKDNPEIINMVNMGPCNKLYKRALVKDNFFDDDIKYEDVNFVVSALLKANKIIKINDYLSYYVIHNGSETTTRDERIFDIIEVVKRLHEKVKTEAYLKSNFTDLAVMILSDYTIQTKFIADKRIRNKFIDLAFITLDEIDTQWRRSKYLKTFPKIKRIIKTNKTLAKIYCNLYNLKNCFKNK